MKMMKTYIIRWPVNSQTNFLRALDENVISTDSIEEIYKLSNGEVQRKLKTPDKIEDYWKLFLGRLSLN